MSRSAPSQKQSQSPKPPAQTLKLVLVGDSTVGKTSLLYSYKKNKYYDNEIFHTSVLEGFSKTLIIDDEEITSLLWDTIGSSDFEKLRPLSYPKTDCFIICYAINNRTSFKNVETKWIPEIKNHCPDTIPLILVGTKSDLINSEQAPNLITKSEAKDMQEIIEAGDFLECSAQDIPSIEAIVISAVRVTLKHQEEVRKQLAAAQPATSNCSIF